MNEHYPGFTKVGTFSPDNLIAGDFPRKSKSVTLAGGFAYKRGTVLSETTGKFGAVTADADAAYILAEDVDATGGDISAVVYMTGEFNSRAITIGEGATLAGVAATLEARNIYLRDSVAA